MMAIESQECRIVSPRKFKHRLNELYPFLRIKTFYNQTLGLNDYVVNLYKYYVEPGF